AFDNSTTSMWLSAEAQAENWLAYEWLDGPKTIVGYAIEFSNGGLTSRAPRDWTLEAWNGSAWIVKDTRTGEIHWKGRERREYPLASPGSYSRYRLNVTEDNDDRPSPKVVVISIARLELL